MAKFSSTLLPASSDITETRKAILDLLAKINAVADSIYPVSNPRNWNSTYVYSNTAPAASTFYTVTVPNLPVGTKSVWITGYITGTHVAGTAVDWRPFGSTDTRVQSAHRQLAVAAANNAYAAISGMVEVDSAGRFEVCVTDANADIYIYGYTWRW